MPEIFNFLCSVLARAFLTPLAINVTYYFKKKVELRGVLNHHTALVSHILDNFLNVALNDYFPIRENRISKNLFLEMIISNPENQNFHFPNSEFFSWDIYISKFWI